VKKSAPAVNSALLPNFLSENRQTRPGHPPPRAPPFMGGPVARTGRPAETAGGTRTTGARQKLKGAIRAPLLAADLESSGEGRGHFVLVIDIVISVIACA
jgi:hypothetical protein